MEIEEQPATSAPQQLTTEQLIRKYFFSVVLAFGGCLILTAAIISSVLWYQTKVLNEKIDLLQTATGKVLDRLSTNPNDPLSVFKITAAQDITLKENSIFTGYPNAPVTVVEYEDFQCPFCHQFFDTVYPSLKADYIDTQKVKFIQQDFAFLGDESLLAAEAAKCGQDQNKFWEYRKTLYDNQGDENAGNFTADKLQKFATDLGLNSSEFAACLSNHTHKAEVEEQTNLGKSNGVTATPTFFINGKIVEGAIPYADLKRILDFELENNK